jgi:hypothetical protein
MFFNDRVDRASLMLLWGVEAERRGLLRIAYRVKFGFER